MTMPLLALDHLDPHPANANRMDPDLFAKLKAHISRTGDCPPLIVRRHPDRPDRFQILDGHHRAKVLRELDHDAAQCAIWEVNDDAHAALLLLTLNRLHGQDDPRLRGSLLEQLQHEMSAADLADLLPDSADEIQALIRMVQPPKHDEAMMPPPDVDRMPQAVTFFLTESQHARLNVHLRAIDHDRSVALIKALHLDADPAKAAPDLLTTKKGRSRR